MATQLSLPKQIPQWSHKKLTDPRAGPVLVRIASLAEARLIGVMIIKDFLGHRIAPFHAHSRPLWEFTIGGDPICVHVSGMMHNKLDGALVALLGPCHEDLPRATPPLYAYDDIKGIVAEVPAYNE